ncbi:MAG TPA: ammonia-dependent NAD(+) synthetase [Castellaniella sp.]|uniref:ammonia-dependent NAD(+) synthetase n=1 Tax=Castellaniella sp. TaxID=1955812 RepID=UPI002EE7F5D2
MQIRLALGVTDAFEAQAELTRRVDFLAELLRSSGARALVLGISGGVDSMTAGCLSQRAVQQVRDSGGDARFVAMRLPYGTQLDEADAQACLQVIQPDELMTVDVKPASDAMLASVQAAGQVFRDAAQQDFIHGNIKARARMVAQYAVAGSRGGLVVGTDHAAESLMGFFTKFGDGAADTTPLAGLNKRRVRALAALMGAPDALVYKVPTADLELLKPLKPDEDAFGVTYAQIDDFLEGKDVSQEAFDVIVRTWRKSAHKRALPIAP